MQRCYVQSLSSIGRILTFCTLIPPFLSSQEVGLCTTLCAPCCSGNPAVWPSSSPAPCRPSGRQRWMRAMRPTLCENLPSSDRKIWFLAWTGSGASAAWQRAPSTMTVESGLLFLPFCDSGLKSPATTRAKTRFGFPQKNLTPKWTIFTDLFLTLQMVWL